MTYQVFCRIRPSIRRKHWFSRFTVAALTSSLAIAGCTDTDEPPTIQATAEASVFSLDPAYSLQVSHNVVEPRVHDAVIFGGDTLLAVVGDSLKVLEVSAREPLIRVPLPHADQGISWRIARLCPTQAVLTTNGSPGAHIYDLPTRTFRSIRLDDEIRIFDAIGIDDGCSAFHAVIVNPSESQVAIVRLTASGELVSYEPVYHLPANWQAPLSLAKRGRQLLLSVGYPRTLVQVEEDLSQATVVPTQTDWTDDAEREAAGRGVLIFAAPVGSDFLTLESIPGAGRRLRFIGQDGFPIREHILRFPLGITDYDSGTQRFLAVEWIDNTEWIHILQGRSIGDE